MDRADLELFLKVSKTEERNSASTGNLTNVGDDSRP
jgi:hypothetical protein